MDALARLIDEEIQRQVAARTPATDFAVWIDGQGWLKNRQGRIFVALHPAVAQTAALLCGRSAVVLPTDFGLSDGSLEHLEAVFLDMQAKPRAAQWQRRLGRWVKSAICRARVSRLVSRQSVKNLEFEVRK